MAAPKKVDYERIEPDWRAGLKSPAQLAAEYTAETGVSVSHAAIIKHFKKLGIPRDLKAKVRAKADAMVMASMVTGKVSTETTKRDAEIIADSAVVVANLQVSHRKDISRARNLVMSLLGEIEAQTNDPQLFDRLGELVVDTGGDTESKLLEAYRRVIATPGRIDGMKKLAETLKVLISLEREAYGLAETERPPSDNAQLLKEIAAHLPD